MLMHQKLMDEALQQMMVCQGSCTRPVPRALRSRRDAIKPLPAPKDYQAAVNDKSIGRKSF
jgi:hypothetical protein